MKHSECCLDQVPEHRMTNEAKEDYSAFLLAGLLMLALVVAGTAIINSAPLPGTEHLRLSIPF